MNGYQAWSNGWIKEGHYIEYLLNNVRYYERVLFRDFAHWEYEWEETITSEATSGPFTPDDLEITRGYRPKQHRNRVWQLIFGIKGQVEIYIEAPTDLHRHGIPKDPKPGTDNRFVSHFEEYMSPFYTPSFITEHFMMRPDVQQMSFDAYNPDSISHADVRLNFMINKMETERVGTISFSDTGINFEPTNDARWGETLRRLWSGLIPCRPISLLGVRAPAEAPTGE